MKFNSIEQLNLQRNITFIKYSKQVPRQATMSKTSFHAQEKSCFNKLNENQKMKKRRMMKNKLQVEIADKDSASLKQEVKPRRREDVADILNIFIYS